MKNKVFEDFDMLAEYMIDYADEGKVISAVLFYDEAIELMRELLVYEEVEPVLLDISDPKFNGYEQEYYITLTSDYQLCIENAFANGVYLTHEADVVLLMEMLMTKYIRLVIVTSLMRSMYVKTIFANTVN